jgi:membrane fusion protein (multidrug efflux system)
MTATVPETAARMRVPRKAVAALAALAALILLLLYLQGALGGRAVAPGEVPLAAEQVGAAAPVAVEEREVEDVVDWPGTVTARLTADVAPAVMARVLAVRVGVGSAVRQGDVIATLDDRALDARTQQGVAALAAAEAQAQQAEADLRRARTLFAKRAYTQQDLDAAATRAAAARAQAAQARDALNQARVALGEASVRAPFDGVIVARLVDPGDMAGPGKPVAVLQDPATLRLEANLPERCAAPLALGLPLAVRVGSPPVEVAARVEEIAPVADPTTRTRLVKLALPPQAALRPGAFATLRLGCDRHRALLVPAAAVQRAGQLESVRVLVDGQPRLRSVRIGKAYGDAVEVLAGLRSGDTVLVTR